MGVAMATKIRSHLASLKLPPDTSSDEVMEHLADFIEKTLAAVEAPILLKKEALTVIILAGVNGSGKTTTISKLAKKWIDEGNKVELVACDTFRAAATEQLEVWASRLNVKMHTTKSGHDASGLAFDALQKAQQNGADILLIDTAGRLQNKEHLMNELSKIQRVLKKIIPDAPHHMLLILDAATGQNIISQVEAFNKVVNVTGLILTKLDGTAKGGIAVALADRFGIPIHSIGIGESMQDLQAFSAHHFARALLDLDERV
jgi:fused signal recognition particle receptor